ncbi:pilus assembly protein PilP [Saccharospirillum salsuginis]|uniref:Type 4 fimbrial biogenesis protein PilP n=1 Tax=Saccharospirillum salsuginis TaxID=418750 RepID=A0A918K255_9GAMM|nr:pilus assembly protein PilP [Saccharospirillum salsuginis]GGX44501.1 type 4 fimbrial biogenesis protein PilP [Saccharospirillum salsuginis]
MKQVSWIVPVVVLLTACVQEDPLADLRDYVEEVNARPSGSIPPPPEYKSFELVSYTASGERSPFEVPRPVEVESEEGEEPKSNVRPDPNRVPEYLESFRIENLAMVGTLTGLDSEALWALIRDGNGEIHRVQVGNFLGRNHGQIINISETQIDLIEIVPSGQDNWVERPRAIVLSGLDE